MKTARAKHPDEAALLQLAAGDESRGNAGIRRHLAACAGCRKRLEGARRMHDGLRPIGASEKSRAKRPISAERRMAYRRRIVDIFYEAREADRAADAILRAVRLGGSELRTALKDIRERKWHGLVLYLVARRGAPFFGIDPRRGFDLAQALLAEARMINAAARTSVGLAGAIQVRAMLLLSQALTALGETAQARSTVRRARCLLERVAVPGLLGALSDYFEGEAAIFEQDDRAAERLLSRAKTTFAESGAERYLARSNAALGTMLVNRGEYESALPYYEAAASILDSHEDAHALTMTLNNWASGLAQLGRFSDARRTYAKALALARPNGFARNLIYIRTGLAEIDFLEGRYEKALRAFRDVARESAATGTPTDVAFAGLYAAECLGRMHRFGEMASELELLRKLARKSPFDPSPALNELFACLDKGTLDADLVGHVREYLQDAERGVRRSYRALRRA